MKILSIPIEPLEERYSVQWDKWFTEQFVDAGLNFDVIYGGVTSNKINRGSFLDVVETNMYKTSQLYAILEILSTYDDKEPLVLFFHDLWFPGLTNIAYIRDGLGLQNLKICGCLHAGSYDEHDFLNKKEMTFWAHDLENCMLGSIADEIYVATEFHKNLLCSNREVHPSKVQVTGFPIYPVFVDKPLKPLAERGDIVVFPHRLDSEKRPDLFDKLKQDADINTMHLIKTKEIAKTKAGYYKILQDSLIAVSFAEQETWGIAMQEAVLCGCIPVLPNRLSYAEIYDKIFLYNTFEEAKEMIKIFAVNPPTTTFEKQRQQIIEKGEQAIPNIIKHIQAL
jgi:hypothetical protein